MLKVAFKQSIYIVSWGSNQGVCLKISSVEYIQQRGSPQNRSKNAHIEPGFYEDYGEICAT